MFQTQNYSMLVLSNGFSIYINEKGMLHWKTQMVIINKFPSPNNFLTGDPQFMQEYPPMKSLKTPQENLLIQSIMCTSSLVHTAQPKYRIQIIYAEALAVSLPGNICIHVAGKPFLTASLFIRYHRTRFWF